MSENTVSFQIGPREMHVIEDFMLWMKRYKDHLIESIVSPDMDDEIILISCEETLINLYSELSQAAKKATNDLIDNLFRDPKLSRLELFIYNQLATCQLTEQFEQEKIF